MRYDSVRTQWSRPAALLGGSAAGIRLLHRSAEEIFRCFNKARAALDKRGVRRLLCLLGAATCFKDVLSMDLSQDSLLALRAQAYRAVRKQAGEVQLGNYKLRFDDLLSFYMEIKNIFWHKIYHFTPRASDPVIVDGGAHLGLATVYFKTIAPAARILCFEPDPDVNLVLRDNLARNNFNDVSVVEAGLSAENGTVTFEPDGADGGRISDERSAGITIKTVRLSDYIDGPVDFLKLNIEGAELDVLEDLERTGKLKFVNEIVLEYHGWPQGPQRLGALLSLLERNGFWYRVHDFDHETNPACKPPFRIQPGVPWFALVYGARG